VALERELADRSQTTRLSDLSTGAFANRSGTEVQVRTATAPRLGAEGLRLAPGPSRSASAVGSGTPNDPTTGVPSRSTPSPAPTAPSAGYPKKHKVVENDSFWKLAKQYYGVATPSLATHIAKANPGIDPLRLPLDKDIAIPAPPPDFKAPAPSAASQASSSPVPDRASSGSSSPRTGGGSSASVALSLPRKYVVQKGDSLSGLAVKFYGSSQKAYLIREANLDLKYGGYLIAGQTITIPAAR
jgi:nucleoid-associated protein YgaU